MVYFNLDEMNDQEVGVTSEDNSDRKPRPKSAPIFVEESDGKSEPVLTSFEMKALKT